jgi:hypothetical protein
MRIKTRKGDEDKARKGDEDKDTKDLTLVQFKRDFPLVTLKKNSCVRRVASRLRKI